MPSQVAGRIGSMTYNFDPERWYENHLALLERGRRLGELDEGAFEDAVAALDREYEAMVARLDGTYQIPAEPQRKG
jgi:thiamine biosynthesis lipoprotein ApbE